MITYQDPDTGYMCKCSKPSSVPEGVTWYEVPSHPKDEYNEAISGYDTAGDGSPIFDQTKVDEINRKNAKAVRDQALEDLEYDFGDGRVMQVRPQDESNIRNAIEVINNNSLPGVNWRMKDNSTASVTASDLQTALAAGQLAALAIWDTYNNA